MDRPTVSEGKRGKTVHSEARNMVANVISKCDEESKNNQLALPLNKSSERAALYTNKSLSFINKLRSEAKKFGNTPLLTPGKKRKRASHRNAEIDSFDKCVIRRIVSDYYVQFKKSPSLRTLLITVKEKLDFPWEKETLRRILHEIGFRWKKCSNRRKILIERPDIVNWRVKYLQSVTQLRSENRQIFYMDESWVDSNLTFQKCWQSEDVVGVLTTNRGDNRLIVVHIGSDEGFLQGAELIFKAGTSTGDYHGQMNKTNFDKWVQEKLIPLLPPHSVIVMDNAPYHNIQVDKPPSKNSIKADMTGWLDRHGVQYDVTMKKANLIDLINKHKPLEKVYKVDALLREHGHTVLRLPPYMCDLNPIELAWSKVKRLVREQNVTGALCLTRLKDLTISAVNAVTKEDWVGYVSHVKKIEADYWKKDGILEDTIDSIVIQLGVDSDEDSSSEGSMGDSEDDDEGELARPLPD